VGRLFASQGIAFLIKAEGGMTESEDSELVCIKPRELLGAD